MGVNQPSVMPPIKITGAIKAMTAEKLKRQSNSSSAANAMPVARLGDTPASVINQIDSGNASTISTSSPAPPRRFQLNATSPPQLLRRA
ncbi:Uncharacterised protein [Achromobacter denitrificans]|nr:Uncharacterised protein [Achromobacter denitrificans]